jgi:hypothetical protein
MVSHHNCAPHWQLAAGSEVRKRKPVAKGGAQGAPKKKKKTGVPTYLPLLIFFEIFRSDFRKYFYGVFGLLMQRNGQKRDKKNRWEKMKGKKFFFSQLFRPKVFDMDFPKKFFMELLNSPC